MTCLPPLRAVIFDRDDTIACTDPAVFQEAARWGAQRHALSAAQVGRELAQHWQEHSQSWWELRTPAQEDAFWNIYGLGLMRRLGLPEDAAAGWMAAFPYERFLRPAPGARVLLSTLRERGLRIGVLSNTMPSIGRSLEAVGLADLIDVAVATATLGVHKPEPEPYLHSLRALGVSPAEALFIDDKPENVQAAQRLGLQAGLIDLTGRTPGALDSLAGVLDLVEARGVAAGLAS